MGLDMEGFPYAFSVCWLLPKNKEKQSVDGSFRGESGHEIHVV